MKEQTHAAACKAALDWLSQIPADATLPTLCSLAEQSLGAQRERLESILPPETEKNAPLRQNLFVAATLVYLFCGQYPGELFGQENGYVHYKHAKEAYLAACATLPVDRQMHIRNERALSEMEKGVRGAYLSRLLCASACRHVGVLEQLCDAMLRKDTCYAAKYTAADWAKMLTEAEQSRTGRATPVFAASQRTANHEFHAVTVRGENHKRCDDCSGIIRIHRGITLAYCADGVGSAAHSALGAQKVGQAFADQIAAICQRYRKSEDKLYAKLLGVLTGTQRFQNKNVYVATCESLRNRLKRTVPDFDQTPLSDYATTFLFTLITDRFVACGKIGDGVFVVEKHEKLATQSLYGYLAVTDGISGEVQNNPMTVWHLEKNPSAVQVQIFSPVEVSAVLMATDGANALRFLPIGQILLAEDAQDKHVRAHLARLRSLSFAEADAALCEQALCCSDGNAMCGGRGDDCSLVYIRAKE